MTSDISRISSDTLHISSGLSQMNVTSQAGFRNENLSVTMGGSILMKNQVVTEAVENDAFYPNDLA
jgi:hypothetical protein